VPRQRAKAGAEAGAADATSKHIFYGKRCGRDRRWTDPRGTKGGVFTVLVTASAPLAEEPSRVRGIKDVVEVPGRWAQQPCARSAITEQHRDGCGTAESAERELSPRGREPTGELKRFAKPEKIKELDIFFFL